MKTGKFLKHLLTRGEEDGKIRVKTTGNKEKEDKKMASTITPGKKAYYLSKSNKILCVVVHWCGFTKTGKYMAKVGFPGKSEAEAFWVDADRLSLARHTLERVVRDMRDDCGIY